MFAARFVAAFIASEAVASDDALLTHTPIIMTHDAATGYLGKGLVNAWAKTQSGPFAEQLDCGARAFDARPLLDDKEGLIWHHGSVKVDHAFADSVAEIVEWCGRNPTELVLLPISACSGSGCMSAVRTALSAAGVKDLQTCDPLKGMTYGDAKRLGALSNGGALLAVTGPSHSSGVACSYGNYDSSLACTDDQGFAILNDHQLASTKLGAPMASFDCWNSSKTASIPVNRMFSYLDGVSEGGLSEDSFTQHQAIWQESTRSVVVGTLRGSSLLMDEEKSGLNAIITESVNNMRWTNINFLEVNNVCDGGLELFNALRNMANKVAV